MTPEEAIDALRQHGGMTSHEISGVIRTLKAESDACQKELGYEEGTLLENIKRFKAYANSEIRQAWAGAAKLKDYAESLQARLSEKDVQEVAEKALDEAFKSSPMTARDCALEHRFHENLKGNL